ncbi:hypothetical protein C8A01DRAFT_20641 [Parachaetomium inaequale]|uniref:C2H2-type domain-containing protein n=1 Tax=Parachaetomium inaequale TaxID=2588326 RepID=A0AAN6SKZ6_9PEZI|nr:hypothetical protein C8A01DRAFT_20641 [Parachaetomium inaequale]
MDGPLGPHPDAPGGQTPWIPAVPAQLPHAIASPPGKRRFECSVLACGRHFTRKEHLTRHAKSHSSHPQHQCPICGRRYARR